MGRIFGNADSNAKASAKTTRTMTKNPFDGKGAYTNFVWKTYSRLMTREKFSLADVMADRMGLKSAENLPFPVTKCDGYTQLKKASEDVISLLKEREGADSVLELGNQRCRKYQYVGVEANPLEDLQNAQAINDVRRYAQFCADSSGFFPMAWLEHFFEETIDLLQIKKRRKGNQQMISSSLDRELKNVGLLPTLYEAVRDKNVLDVRYKPFDLEEMRLEFHPHLLKEFNGRWFLLGHAAGKEPQCGFNLALDRIVEVKKQQDKTDYISAPQGFYQDRFKDIVGVSVPEGEDAEDVVVRVFNESMFHLVETKKIHHSQQTVTEYGDHADGCYGEFRMHVKVNNEFMARILEKGETLMVVSPESLRERIKAKVIGMASHYGILRPD